MEKIGFPEVSTMNRESKSKRRDSRWLTTFVNSNLKRLTHGVTLKKQ